MLKYFLAVEANDEVEKCKRSKSYQTIEFWATLNKVPRCTKGTSSPLFVRNNSKMVIEINICVIA